MLYMTVLTIGSLLSALALGPWFESYYLLLVGRLLYGLGAESAYIAIDAIVAIWWDGKYLAFAMGLQVAAGRLVIIFKYRNISNFILNFNNDYF